VNHLAMGNRLFFVSVETDHYPNRAKISSWAMALSLVDVIKQADINKKAFVLAGRTDRLRIPASRLAPARWRSSFELSRAVGKLRIEWPHHYA